MNDYDALRDYLQKQKLPEFVLSFEQIEAIIDAALISASVVRTRSGTKRFPLRPHG